MSSTEGPTIEAWPAKSDGDTSEDLLTLIDVNSSLGFTVVVIEPPLGLTFAALAAGESHDHCMLPHVEGQWSAHTCFLIEKESRNYSYGLGMV